MMAAVTKDITSRFRIGKGHDLASGSGYVKVRISPHGSEYGRALDSCPRSSYRQRSPKISLLASGRELDVIFLHDQAVGGLDFISRFRLGSGLDFNSRFNIGKPLDLTHTVKAVDRLGYRLTLQNRGLSTLPRISHARFGLQKGHDLTTRTQNKRDRSGTW